MVVRPAQLCLVRRWTEGKTISNELKGAADAAEGASNSRAFVITARAGFAVSGGLHILIGAIAMRLAFGKSGEADQGGAMSQLAGQPAGVFLLWIAFTACLALALWQLSETAFGHRQLQGKTRLGKKLSAAVQGAVYLVLALAFASFAVGSGKNSGQSTSDATAKIMQAPLGPLLLVAVGAAVAVVGIAFVVRGIKRSFTKKLALPAAGTGRSIVVAAGVVGYIAKGIVLVLVGLLFIIATVQARPKESTGVDGALKAVREQPYGLYLLSLLGVGLICYGIYQIIKARFARM
ncbi:DUF1206 domain-containing protein [Arthrobacter wenxiniae]|uniref:DUF1206 domain-containing protein n=1 Tax=Arthrobacter wenxiniae TaxID=2713570 RepID=A0A7Y7LXV3_9MICC|nr:DUF1206 domain-containing protein [Arthrobacter wenxiniae]NVM94267.1 DUF1206 domain-containing protein [Arthrobacter wenxiniae]